MKNRLFKHFLFTLFLGSIFTLSACDKDDDPEIEDEQELITTLIITLVPEEGKGQTVIGTFSDPDGDGGNPPTANTLNLEANTIYNATITLFDESQTPAIELTTEVKDEGDEHELFFETLNGLILAITKTDLDKNNRPIGLEARVVTSGSSSGKLRITLKHQPGLKGTPSDITKGETDVQALFDVVVQ